MIKINTAVFLIFVFVICSCNTPSGKQAIQIWTDKIDIYVAGDDADSAAYWKNGEVVHLAKPGISAHAAAIIVLGADVYVAGYEILPNKNHDPAAQKPQKGESVVVDTGSTHYKPQIAVALYWKNGKPMLLTDATADAETTAIAISGNDVYVCGFEYSGQITAGTDHGRKSVAKYWKNGVPVLLTDGLCEARAMSIFVSGTDIYVAGYEDDANPAESNRLHAVRYWKNGKRMELTVEKHLSNNNDFSEGHSIFVDGKDVYIAGTQSGIATYWKNGFPEKLVKGEDLRPTDKYVEPVNSTATAIVVSGPDVYVAGTQDTLDLQNSEAKYWKNGKAYTLTHAPDDMKGPVLLSVYHKDAFITAGFDGGSALIAKIWKNSTPAVLKRGTVNITSICVVPKSVK
ncbi:hypothetical protein [Mucilaginibacter sp.]|uniref:hypothetical protein n=1 Tax=Mucilaginibacter sp. TaxID=1882438 RepID=UPI0035BBBE6B